MVMELCEGGALDTRFLSFFPTGLPHLTNMAATILRQVVSAALHHIYGLGIVHRDVKAQNLLLAFDAHRKSTMVSKLADFGLAARFRRQLDTGIVVIPCTGICGHQGLQSS